MKPVSKQYKRGASGIQDKCPECGSTNPIYVHDTSETYCGNCGLFLYQEMRMGPEWRAFTREEREERNRVGMPTSYSVHDKGLATTMGRVDRDAYGRKLPLSTQLEMWRLKKWNIRSRVHSSVDRNLAQAMTELNRLSDKVYVSGPVKEKAAVIYRKALDKGIVRGRSIAGIAAAAIYAACRTSETPRTLREISEASLVKKKDVARCYRFLLRELDIRMPIADPLTCISKIAGKTGISGPTQGLAIKILGNAKKQRFSSGKDPYGLAAASLYIACLQNNEKKTQKDIAEVAGVTEVTVRNRYKELRRRLEIKIPDQ